jgi:predicted acetyltransferase
MNIYGKFGWNLFSGFREEEINVKRQRTLTHDKSSQKPDELKNGVSPPPR